MKKFLFLLSLVFGFADEATLVFTGYEQDSQKGFVSVNLAAYPFNVSKDRRELVKEIYAICQNPPAQLKSYIQSSLDRADAPSIDLAYYHPSAEGNFDVILTCFYDRKGVLSAINRYSTPSVALDELVKRIVDNRDFSDHFVRVIDCARSELAAKGGTSTMPSKNITLKFGASVVDRTSGQKTTLDLGDLAFDVNQDRGELVRKVYQSCKDIDGDMLNFVGQELISGTKKPNVSVYYFDDKGRLSEFETLKCTFNEKGVVSMGMDNISTPNQKNYDNKTTDQLIKTRLYGSRGKIFSHEFLSLVDAANFEEKAKNTSKSSKKK